MAHEMAHPHDAEVDRHRTSAPLEERRAHSDGGGLQFGGSRRRAPAAGRAAAWVLQEALTAAGDARTLGWARIRPSVSG